MGGQHLAGPAGLACRPAPGNPGFARQMTLLADAVPARRIQPRRIDDPARPPMISRRHPINLVFPRAVASLATDASLQKRRAAETILRARHRLEPAGVTLQAPRLDRPR